MRKSILIMTIMLSVVIALSSCKSDDEIYNPTCKISKIWYRSDVGDPSEIYNYDDKGVLTDIAIDSTGSYQFSYNKDKTVSQIVHQGKDYTETVDMTYMDQLVNKIVYTVNDTIRQEIDITRDAETQRITTATETYDKVFFDRYSILSKSRLYNAFVGDIREVHKMMSASATKDLILHCTKTFTYYPGKKEKYDNIAQVVETYPDLLQEITKTYTYDTLTYNPFYGLPYAYANYAGYYLNNKSSETRVTKTNGTITRTVTIAYNYTGTHYLNDKNYPRQFTTTSSENNVPIHTYILYVK